MVALEAAISGTQPKMITVVHCETPSGTLNPLEELGRLKEKYEVPLLYVDAVSSVGGTPVLTDEWKIDLCLGGSQKAFSVPPAVAFLTVSEGAWEIAEKVNYFGYDALLPFRTAVERFYFPYTPNWHGLAGLYAATALLLDEGIDQVFARHAAVAETCRRGLEAAGLRLYPAPGAIPAPTVSAAYVPEGITWEELDRRFRQYGLVVGGSYGPLAGKIFRLGHMGSQADMELLGEALDVIREVIKKI
jgi:aspartate aminotransferase-like enzyme